MKQVIWLLLFICNNTLCSLFQQSRLIWCTEQELHLLLHDPQTFKAVLTNASEKNQFRFKQLWIKRSQLFWHLRESTVGICSQIKINELLAWNFSLHDFSTKQEGNVLIAISGRSKIENCFDLKKNGDRPSYLEFLNGFTKGDHRANEEPNPCSGIDQGANVFNEYSIDLHDCHDLVTVSLIQQIVPFANIKILEIFDILGNADTKKLCQALRSTKDLAPDIVHLGLKITKLRDQDEINQRLKQLQYVVAAAGNGGTNKAEAYPARCIDVAFDVGAFNAYKDICEFSQHEKGIGPKFVAPGLDLLCPIHIPGYNTIYILTSGTSMAAALVTGFLALFLSEFKDSFSYQQLLTMIYECARSQKTWRSKALLGAIDMRTTLFCAHVLKTIKLMIPYKIFCKNYEKLIAAILFFNRIHSAKDMRLNGIKKIFTHYNNLQDLMQITANYTLQALCLKPKRRQFKNLFDKQLIHLVRNSINHSFNRRFRHLSDRAKKRVEYSLNRQK